MTWTNTDERENTRAIALKSRITRRRQSKAALSGDQRYAQPMTSEIRAERLGVRLRVDAAFHFLGKVASQLRVIALFSIHEFLKPSNILEHSSTPK